MKNQNIKMQAVSKMSDSLKAKVFNELTKGFQTFSKADHYVVGYIKNDHELMVYKIPTDRFYALAKKLMYVSNSSDKYKSLSLRLYRYSESREILLKNYYIESFNIDELKKHDGNNGFKFESFIEDQYKMIHNETDDIENGGIDAKKDNVNYQIKLEAASMKMFRLWYECNDFFYNNGWV